MARLVHLAAAPAAFRRLATVCLAVSCVAVASGARAHAQQEAVPVPTVVPATPANAAPFLGNWSVAATGPNGPAVFALSVKEDAGAVVGEISSDQMPRQAIKDVSKAGPALLLAFMFDYQGTPVPVLVTLTPAENRIDAVLDFADGAYVLTGAATRAEGSATPQP